MTTAKTDTETGARGGSAASAESSGRWSLGLIAVVAGLVAILGALAIVVGQFDKAADVGAVLGVVVSPISAIVGAHFGVQAGASGKAAADKNAKDANNTAIALAAGSDPTTAMETLQGLSLG